MISFIQLSYRSRQPRGERGFGSVGTALILALIVCFQLGLLVWVFMKDWHG
jgi:hypothetical protein